MAKNDWESFFQKYSKVYSSMKSAATMTKIGNFAADKIRVRTRTGYGVPKAGAEKEKLAALSESYIAAREKDDSLSSETRPGASNLTRTGQMLDSIEVVKASEGQAIISVSGSRDDGKTNREIAKFHRDGIKRKRGGPVKRIFLNLSGSEQKQVQGFIRRIITALLKSGT